MICLEYNWGIVIVRGRWISSRHDSKVLEVTKPMYYNYAKDYSSQSSRFPTIFWRHTYVYHPKIDHIESNTKKNSIRMNRYTVGVRTVKIVSCCCCCTQFCGYSFCWPTSTGPRKSSSDIASGTNHYVTSFINKTSSVTIFPNNNVFSL